jgi:hypothetical protein
LGLIANGGVVEREPLSRVRLPTRFPFPEFLMLKVLLDDRPMPTDPSTTLAGITIFAPVGSGVGVGVGIRDGVEVAVSVAVVVGFAVAVGV